MEKVIPEGSTVVGHYTPGILVVGGKILFISGQIPNDANADIKIQTKQALEKIEKILQAAGATKENVVKVTVFLTDISQFSDMNQTYAEFFGDHKPARAAIQVAALPKGVNIEIEAIAVLPS